ncbi:MAG: hypothetical protein ABJA89_04760 [Lapillicoccus sp.]
MLRTVVAAVALASAGAVVMIPAAEAAGAGAAGAGKPGQCATTDGKNVGVKVAVSAAPTTVSVADTMGSTTAVTVTFPSAGKDTTFALTSANPSLRLTDATWCVTSTATSAPVSGSGLTGTSPATNKNDAPHRIGYVTIYSVTATHLLGGTLSCYSQTPYGYDISWGGEVGANNAIGYDTTDGSCHSDYQYQLTLVLGDDRATATDTCQALFPGYGEMFRVENLSQSGYKTAPANVWLCTDQI